jgi:endonuclease-3
LPLKDSDQDLLETRQRLAVCVIHELSLHFGNPVWRTPLPALDELVSTILSQNTNDHNRDSAFFSLKVAFPTWEAVRDAQPEKVIAAIRTAGLANQKGLRIQNLLQEITLERGQLDLDFLKDWGTEPARHWLEKFKGVGPKTAAIVLCFSLNKPAFPVDTHIYRVTGRLGLRDATMNVEKSHLYLESVISQESYYSGHLNLIRLGREVCHPHKPDCPNCPLNRYCPFFMQLSTNRLGGN